MRALHVVMNQEGLRDGTNLLKRLGLENLETFLIIRSIEPFNKRIFVGPMRGTHIGPDTEAEQKPDERGRKVASGGSTSEARITIKGHLLRAAVRL